MEPLHPVSSPPDSGSVIEGGKRVEVLEADLSVSTDADGFVQCQITPGAYTVLVRELGTPGPGRPRTNSPVRVMGGQAAGLGASDCPVCV